MLVMTIKEVSEIAQIPDFQRDQDVQHVELIAENINHSLQAGLTPILPGCIILAKLPTEEHLLIDGNHRAKAIFNTDPELRVFVNIIGVRNITEAEALFRVVNSNMPMPYLPPSVKPADVKSIVRHYTTKYKAAFSNAKNYAQMPNVHTRLFTECIGKIIEYGITKEDIIGKIDAFNDDLSRWSAKSLCKKGDIIKKMQGHIDICTERKFYIGLVCRMSDYSPLLELFQIGNEEPTYVRPRTTIPKGVRLNDFHCAHNVAHKNGGLATVENLYPCCAQCNLSMGDMEIF